MTPTDDVAFHETQRPSAWFLALGISGCAFAAGFFAYAMIVQFVFHRPVGDPPMEDGVLAILGPTMIVLGVVGLIIAGRARLIIEVRRDGLNVQFLPLHLRPKKINLDQLVSIKAVTYRPVLHYGGWGIRWTTKGKGYTARGRHGVRLDYANGRHLLLGSQRPDELAAAIHRLRASSS